MAEIVENCPRCHAQQMTFDLLKSHFTGQVNYGWQMEFEAFCICRKCKRGTIFHLKQSDIEWSNNLKNKNIADFAMNVNSIMSIKGYVSLKDQHSILPPDHVPEEVEKIFKEAATCFAVKCFNAAGTMLRLCIDLSTAPIIRRYYPGWVRGHLYNEVIVQAEPSLQRILANQVIEARSPYGYFKLKIDFPTQVRGGVDPAWVKSVCFSESPLSEIKHFYEAVVVKRNEYKKFGLGFWQEQVRVAGGNPVLYVDSRTFSDGVRVSHSSRSSSSSFFNLLF